MPRMMLRRCIMALALGSALAMSATAHAAEVAFDLRIERGQVQPDMRRIRVRQGDAVTLRWRTDRKAILHLHGYDIEKTAEPGAVAEMSFTARATGRFAVSVHKQQAGGSHSHEPPLTHVEVHPR